MNFKVSVAQTFWLKVTTVPNSNHIKCDIGALIDLSPSQVHLMTFPQSGCLAYRHKERSETGHGYCTCK